MKPEELTTVRTVLQSLRRHPFKLLVVRWNWKSAILSSVIRALIFFRCQCQCGAGCRLGGDERDWLSKQHRPALVGLSCERMDDHVAAWIADNALTHKLAQLYLREFYLPLFDYHIANSHYTAKELQQAMSARHKRLVMVQPMGVNIGIFAPMRRSAKERQKRLTLVAGNNDDFSRRRLHRPVSIHSF